MKKRPRFYTQTAVFNLGLSVHAVAVYCYLSFRANREGTCFPSRNTIAGGCGISPRTVDKALGELIEAGAVVSTPQYRPTIKGRNRQTSNLYQLVDLEQLQLQEVQAPTVEDAGHSMQEVPGVGAPDAQEIYNKSNLKESNKERISIYHCDPVMDERLADVLENVQLGQLSDRQFAATLENAVVQMYHAPAITVNGATIPQAYVRSQLDRLNDECVHAVYQNLLDYGAGPRCGVKYLMVCLYNAADDMDAKILAELIV